MFFSKDVLDIWLGGVNIYHKEPFKLLGILDNGNIVTQWDYDCSQAYVNVTFVTSATTLDEFNSICGTAWTMPFLGTSYEAEYDTPTIAVVDGKVCITCTRETAMVIDTIGVSRPYTENATIYVDYEPVGPYTAITYNFINT